MCSVVSQRRVWIRAQTGCFRIARPSPEGCGRPTTKRRPSTDGRNVFSGFSKGNEIRTDQRHVSGTRKRVPNERPDRLTYRVLISLDKGHRRVNFCSIPTIHISSNTNIRPHTHARADLFALIMGVVLGVLALLSREFRVTVECDDADDEIDARVPISNSIVRSHSRHGPETYAPNDDGTDKRRLAKSIIRRCRANIGGKNSIRPAVGGRGESRGEIFTSDRSKTRDDHLQNVFPGAVVAEITVGDREKQMNKKRKVIGNL